MLSDEAFPSSEGVARSALLSTFPWLTDFLLGDKKKLLGDPNLARLLESVENFESEILTTYNYDALEFRRALSVVDMEGAMPTQMADLSHHMRPRLCHAMSTYKLIDVLHALDHSDAVSLGRNPRYSRMSSIGIAVGNKSWPMKNWVDVLKSTRSYLNSWETYAQTQTQSSSAGQQDAPMPDLNYVKTKLFDDLHDLFKQQKGAKILINVQMAAIHFFFMIQGYKRLDKFALPDMPNSTEELDASVGGSLQMNQDQVDFIKNLMNKSDAYKRKYPLYVALFISPLALLVDKKLMSRCLDQLDLLKASKALGNSKPDLLLKTEFHMWHALYSIAKGQASAHTAMQKFYSTVPWAEVELLSQSDRDFFKPDATNAGTPISLLSRDTEGPINKDWLLADLRLSLPTSTGQVESSGGQAESSSGINNDTVAHIEDESHAGSNIDEEMGDSTQFDVGSSRMSEVKGKEKEISSPDDPMGDGVQSDEDMEGQSHDGDGMHIDRLEDQSINRDDMDDETTQTPTQTQKDRPTKSRTKLDVIQGPKSYVLRPSRSKKTTVAKTIEPKQSISVSKKPPNKVRKKSVATYMAFQKIGPGSYLEPIDVDVYKAVSDITFKPEPEAERVSGPDVMLYPAIPSEKPIPWSPKFHFPSDLKSFQILDKYVRKFFINGQPRHLASPSESSVAVISNAEYSTMSVDQVQSILRHKHILITDVPHENVSFDSQGLRKLTNLDKKISIQDQSIDVADGYYSKQVRTGTLRQFLKSSLNDSGPILNALSFPLPLTGIQPSTMSSEIEAWQVTEGEPFCVPESQFPVGEMRWGLAATGGARHWIHIDSDGLGTFIDVQCGGKIWIVFSPPANHGKYGFANIKQYLDFEVNVIEGGQWDVNIVPKDGEHWIAEAVYLSRGTRFIMRPNTPHSVFTTEHCITFGGHFYSSTNLQDTFFSIVHCFMADDLITNNEHIKTRRLLLRMMQYVYKCYTTEIDEDEYSAGHLPNLLDNNSLIDVLTLCNFCIFANILDFRTYSFAHLADSDNPTARDMDQHIQWDYNAVPVVDRDYYTYVRGLAILFIQWLSRHYKVGWSAVTGPMTGTEFLRDFAGLYLLNQACAILNYKQQAEDKELVGVKNCTFLTIERQIDYLFQEEEDAWYGDWKAEKENFKDHSTLAFSDLGFVVTKIQAVEDPPMPTTVQDIASLGRTIGDARFQSGADLGFPSTASDAPLSLSESDSPSEDSDSSYGRSGQPAKRKRNRR